MHTDPAQEFARLMQFLLRTDPSNRGESYRVIESVLKGGDASKSVMLAYSIGNKRAQRLYEIIKELEDDYIDEETRGLSLSAIEVMAKIFSPQYFQVGWNGALGNCLPKEHLIALTYMSPIVSRYHPLPIVRAEELDLLVLNLENALSDIVADPTLPNWVVLPLRSGIDDLIFVLRNFILFGHDEAVSRIASLITTAHHAVDAASKSAGRQIGLAGLCAALVLAVDLFAAGPNVSQAYATYRGWMVDAMEVVKPLLTPPPLRLEGPKQPDAEVPEKA